LTIRKDRCKIILFVFIGILLHNTLLAHEELTFIAVRDTLARNERTDATGEISETVMLTAGDTIVTSGDVTFGQITLHGETSHHLIIGFGEMNNWYTVFAKDFIPAGTEDIFGNDIFVDFPLERGDFTVSSASGLYLPIGDVDAMWVSHYFADILRGQNRDRLLEIHPGLEMLADRGFAWHESSDANIRLGRSMFYNSVIMLGAGGTFAVRNIRRTDSGYIVNCIVTTHGYRWQDRRDARPDLAGTFLERYWFGDAITLLLNLDGEYLDIYTYGSGIHLGTYIRVGREFITQYQSLIRTNTADLTNVQWPSRADGSTGVRPRPEPDPVQLAVDDDAEEPAEIPATDTASDIPGQETLVAQDSTNATPPMPWALLAVIAGAVVIVGGAVLVVAKRKRAQG